MFGGRDARVRDERDREEPDIDEDTTCCHLMTFIHPVIRNIIVTTPIVNKWGIHLTWANLFWTATSIGLVVLGWLVLFLILGDTMIPRNEGFGLYFLAVFSYALGWSLSYIPYLNLPPVFGMLLAGLIVRNSGLYNIRADLGLTATAKIRTFCLSFIMIRAGLQLSTTSLRKHPIFLLTLGLIPCSVEMFIVTMCCRGILLYPWDWSFMTGSLIGRHRSAPSFSTNTCGSADCNKSGNMNTQCLLLVKEWSILACMSPVLTLNGILALAEHGYGEDKGLATMLCTAACIDDVHIVSIFAVCFSIVFANEKNRTEWWFYIPAGLRDFILGILMGSILGIWFTFFPHRSHKYATCFRMIGLVLGSLMCTAFTATIAISGGGFLACVIMSFVAITGWRILSASFDSAPLRHVSYVLWHVVQPILAGVIGADIDFTNWCVSRLFLHLLCIFIGLTARSIATYLTTLKTSFTWKERLFVVGAWLPKGTLQAGLGPLAFERVRNGPDLEKIEMALDIIRLSVVTVLILAPLGAFLIAYTGPILLNKITIEEHERQRELSYLRILSLQPDSMPEKKGKHPV